ncbi:hypothetical protein OESDEN_17877 [Oesophagostomum dentatum]|uniref:Uncharacterized protein n=1 Tax=Oesophagostomum dentatum TaxID=61180 RepID=A0A0B1SBX8_OESDE|nr:hypothetical protein OESDEN_17877 [Oesophagostomum dentatum]
MKRTKSKQTSERTPEVKSELTDESKLYPLQKTMGSQRDDSEEKTTGTAEVPLAVDKTPLPSAEPKS